MIAAVVCTGQSVTQADVDLLRGRCKVVVVSDAYKLAPWADAMVSHDKQWWEAHAECDFSGPRYCAYFQDLPKKYRTERFRPSGGNSGCMGLLVANTKLGETPKRILLLGADCKGTHYFGKHTRPGLNNTNEKQFEAIRRQYRALRELPVVNCSPISALDCFPKMSVADALLLHDQDAA